MSETLTTSLTPLNRDIEILNKESISLFLDLTIETGKRMDHLGNIFHNQNDYNKYVHRAEAINQKQAVVTKEKDEEARDIWRAVNHLNQQIGVFPSQKEAWQGVEAHYLGRKQTGWKRYQHLTFLPDNCKNQALYSYGGSIHIDIAYEVGLGVARKKVDRIRGSHYLFLKGEAYDESPKKLAYEILAFGQTNEKIPETEEEKMWVEFVLGTETTTRLFKKMGIEYF